MYIAAVPNRDSPPAILLRESFREGSKVRTRTLANLSHWPPHRIEAFRAFLKGATLGPPLGPDSFEIVRSLPHGHVAATLGSLRRLDLHSTLPPKPTPPRNLRVSMTLRRPLHTPSTL